MVVIEGEGVQQAQAELPYHLKITFLGNDFSEPEMMARGVDSLFGLLQEGLYIKVDELKQRQLVGLKKLITAAKGDPRAAQTISRAIVGSDDQITESLGSLLNGLERQVDGAIQLQVSSTSSPQQN